MTTIAFSVLLVLQAVTDGQYKARVIDDLILHMNRFADAYAECGKAIQKGGFDLKACNKMDDLYIKFHDHQGWLGNAKLYQKPK